MCPMTDSTAAHLALDGGRHAALLAGGDDLEPVGERGIVAAVTGIAESKARKLGACDLEFRPWHGDFRRH
jgi:hypothetical protein